jgi:hypothetical protein
MIASPCRPGPCRGYLSTYGLAARSWASVSLHDHTSSSVVRPVRQAHMLLHGTHGRAPRLDHYN